VKDVSKFHVENGSDDVEASNNEIFLPDNDD
jgi:hypothetical protein